MTTITRRQAMASVGALIGAPFFVGRAFAQTWPTKPIRIVTAFAPGGQVDSLARVYSEPIRKAVGQPVIVESKPGAAGSLAAVEVKRAASDGYTLLFTVNSAMSVNRVLYKDLGYDPDRDFTPISYMPAGRAILFVRSDLGINNVQQLIEYSRKHPVNSGTVGPGSQGHMAVVELNRHFDAKIEAVHYRGASPLAQALHTGELTLGFGLWADAALPMSAGRVKAIAVTGDQRLNKLPNVSTFTEQGVISDAFRLTTYFCVFGPAGMPEPVAQRLSDLFVQAGTSEGVQKLMETNGLEEPALGRAAFKQIYEREVPAWVKLAQGLNIAPQ